MSEEIKITMPKITKTELETIDNNLHEIVNEFIKTTVKDKDLLLSQHIIKRLEEENKQLQQLNKIIYVDKSEKILNKLEEWLEEEIKEWNDLESMMISGRVVYYEEVLEKIKKLKGSDK